MGFSLKDVRRERAHRGIGEEPGVRREWWVRRGREGRRKMWVMGRGRSLLKTEKVVAGCEDWLGGAWGGLVSGASG